MRLNRTVQVYLSLLGIILFPLVVAAQVEASAKTPFLSKNLDNLVQGRLYSPNYFPIKGSPFLTEDWSLENIRLLEKEYRDLPVWYDIYLDDLILLNQQGENLRFIRLNKEHIQYFSLGDRRFINLAYSRYRDLGLKSGYYELSFEDKISLLVSRSLKVLEEDGTLASFFKRDDQRFLVKEGVVFRIRNKKSFFVAVGKAFKQPMKAFIKQQNINLGKAGDSEWMQLVTHLNTLQPDNL